MVKVAIVGAGISGLSLGWYLKKMYGDRISLVIVEKTARAGGWIDTRQEGDFLFEMGPRSCRGEEGTLELIHELGLEEDVIYASSQAKRRYLLIGGQLRELPTGFSGLLTSPWIWPAIPALMKEPFIKKGRQSDESIADFFRRRTNSFVTETLIDPLVAGIYAGDIENLSVKSCFPKLWNWEKEHGSFLKGAFQGGSPQKIFTLRNGLQSITDTLADRLKDSIQYNTTALPKADLVISTVPSKEIESTSVEVIACGWYNEVLEKQGFGYLIPRKEKSNVLGVVFDSSAFPEQNCGKKQTRLTIMASGPIDPIKVLDEQLGIQKAPDIILSKKASHAIPQYRVGHMEKVVRIRKESGIIHLTGSSYDGVSVNDCILNSKRLATHLQSSIPSS